MASRLATLAPRLIALIVIWLLAAASWTLAAGGPKTPPAAPVAGQPTTPEVLVVPEVRRQAYVFSKGILQDAGFAWRVEGPVGGYAANTVVSQTPAPGVRVIDNGAPTVVLRLKRSGEYDERGVPENRSSYKGTAVVLLSNWQAAQKEKAATTTETQPAATTTTSAPPATPPPAPEQGEESVAHRKPDRFGWQGGDNALQTLIQVDRSLYVRFGFGARSERVARRALAYVESRKS